MEAIKQEIKEYRKISESSLHIYSNNIAKLAKDVTGENFKDTEFLHNSEQILEHIESKSLSTRKNYISSILVYLNPRAAIDHKEPLGSLISKYNKTLKDLHTKYMEQISEQKKTAVQSDNWVNMQALMEINKKYRNQVRRSGITLTAYKVTDKNYIDLLQRYLVSSLYLFHPPRRCEYSDCKIISQSDYNLLSSAERDYQNYLVVGGRSAGKKFFSFGDYKTRQHLGLQKIPIKKNLNTVLNLWIKHNPSTHLLIDSRGNKMSRNGLTKYLYKVFADSGRNISTNMLRHIYLTEKYGHESSYKEKQEDAIAMAHSIAVQQQHYVKMN